MPTKLVLQANYINHIIAQYICPFHYVSWDNLKLEWKYENISFRRMWPYYIMIGLIILNIVLFVVMIIFIGKMDKNTIIAGFFVLGGVIMFLVDYLFITCGREWVNAANWMCHHEGITQSKYNFHLPKLLNARKILDFLRPILAGK